MRIKYSHNSYLRHLHTNLQYSHYTIFMAKEIKLSAELRKEEDGKVKEMRKSGYIPAVVYGPGSDNKNIKVKALDFNRVFAVAGESHLIDVNIGDSSVKVIVKDTQKDPVKDNIIHIDFYQVDMNKKITAEIPLNFIGESKAVKEMGGTLIKNLNSLEVRCLPGDLIDGFDIDLSVLDNFNSAIRVSDIGLPQGMELVGDANEMVAGVAEPVKEEEVKKEEMPEEEKEGEGDGEKKDKDDGGEKDKNEDKK